jgi:hypothetical protein
MLGREFLLSELVRTKSANKTKILKGLNDAKARVVKAKEVVEKEFWDAHIGESRMQLRHFEGEMEEDSDIHVLSSWDGELLGRAVSTSDGLVTAGHCLDSDYVQEIKVDGVAYVKTVEVRSAVADIAILSKHRTGYETAPYNPSLPIVIPVLGVIHTMRAEIVQDSNFICFKNDKMLLGPGFSGTPVFQAGKVVAVFVGTQKINPIGFATLVKRTARRTQDLPADTILCMPKPKLVKAVSGTKLESETKFNRDVYGSYPDPDEDAMFSDDYYQSQDDDFYADEESDERSYVSHDYYYAAPNSKKRREKATKQVEVVVMSDQFPTLPSLASSTNPFDDLDEVVASVCSASIEESKVPDELPYNPFEDPAILATISQTENEKDDCGKTVTFGETEEFPYSSDSETDDDVPPPPPPMPKRDPKSVVLWKEAKAADGTPYWYNTITKESTWVKPAEDKVVDVVSPPPTLMTQKEFAALKYQEELEALRKNIREINDQGTFLSGVVDLTADEKVAYAPNTWEKMALIKQLRLLRAKHGALKQRNAVAEKQRKEIARAQTTISKYHSEIAKLEAKILENQGKPDF